MSLLTAELRKVWGNRVFPMLLAVLVTANLLLLWMGTRPTSNQPPAAAYRAVGADLAALGSDMAAKGDLLHSKLDETESLLRLENYFRDSAYGNSVIQQNYREENAALFDQYEQMYRDKSYTLYTDSLTMEYRLLTQLVNEYDTVAGYTDFLESVQTKAGQLAGISIFQNDETGYDLKNIEVTAAVYAGLGETAIDYYPQKGLYTAISYAFTDLILLASMLVLALLVKLDSPGPALFKQKRVGRNEKLFDIYKFRSMYTNADKRLKELNALNQYKIEEELTDEQPDIRFDDLTGTSEEEATLLISDDFVISEEDFLKKKAQEKQNTFVKIENDPRVTRVGRFIRKYSIDELPQLFNVLKGDMSIVGNRPLPLYEAELLTSDAYIERFMAPAGLTGLWQVEKRGGAGKMSAEERKQLDIKYAKEFSFWLDMKILCKTLTAFVQKENV